METRANYAVIGMFTMAVIAAAFGFVYWFAGSESGTKRTPYRIVFTGSVAGLSKGSPVLFNGIRVGDVTDVGLDEKNPQRAVARVEVQLNTPVKEDTKASLDVAILSGTAVVALTGGRADTPDLKAKPGEDLPTIEAERGGLASILETARSTADRANLVLDSVNGLIADNRQSINRAVGNLEAFSDALAKNAPALEGLLSSVASAATRVGPLAEKLEGLTDTATGVLTAVEPDRVRNIMRNVEGVTETVESSRDKIASFMADASALAHHLSASAPKLDSVLSDMSKAFAAIDPVKLNQTIDNAQRFSAGLAASTGDAQATLHNANELTAKLNVAATRVDGVMADASSLVQRLNASAPKLDTVLSDMNKVFAAVDPVKLNQTVDNAQRFSAGLAASTGDAQATLRNANELTAKLNVAATRVDGVMRAAESFLGTAAGKEGKSTFESIRVAMDAFRAASDNLNRRATEIAQAVSRFSTTGSRTVEALGADARRTVNTVGRAAGNLERNPSSVIFGTGRASIPEFSGR